MNFGIWIPLIGTSLGAACVFLLKEELNARVEKLLLGFAAGVMMAASVWSLLIPAIDLSEQMERLAFVPAAVGFLFGILFLYVLDQAVPHLHVKASQTEGGHRRHTWSKTAMLIFAVTLHNIPEGMAVGVVFAGALAGSGEVTLAGASVLAIGIAIQNFPEGAIISMPLKSSGVSKKKAFFYAFLSGVVEPIAAIITIWLSVFLTPILPYLLAFAAGAMIYVIVEELIPESAVGEHSNLGTIGFAVGFLIMMILDVALS